MILIMYNVTIFGQNHGGISIMFFDVVHSFVETPWHNVKPVGICLHVHIYIVLCSKHKLNHITTKYISSIIFWLLMMKWDI